MWTPHFRSEQGKLLEPRNHYGRRADLIEPFVYQDVATPVLLPSGIRNLTQYKSEPIRRYALS